MSAPLPTPVSLTSDFLPLSVACARAALQDADRWLWQGYLAAGNVTLLVGPWKAGKTTLLSVLLARMAAGGDLAGLPVRAGRAVIVTEEDMDHWRRRKDHLRIGDHVTIRSRPFGGRRPTPEQWRQLIEQLVAHHAEKGYELLVIDPLADFIPSGTENIASVMLDFLLPLQAVTRLGVSTLILHHPKQGPTAAGQMARGSGALAGSVDILLELRTIMALDDPDRRRRLSGYSRHQTTPRRLVIELNAEGTDYASLGEDTGNEFEANWQVLSGVLEDTNKKLTRDQILELWPADFVKPTKITLWRWLDKAVTDGRVLVEGTGRRKSPFKYWLKGIEAKWATDPERLFWASLAPIDPLPSMAEVMGLSEPDEPKREK